MNTQATKMDREQDIAYAIGFCHHVVRSDRRLTMNRIRVERTTRGFEFGWTAYVDGVGSSQQYSTLAELREGLGSPHYNWLVYLPDGQHRGWEPIPPL